MEDWKHGEIENPTRLERELIESCEFIFRNLEQIEKFLVIKIEAEHLVETKLWVIFLRRLLHLWWKTYEKQARNVGSTLEIRRSGDHL